MSLVCTCMPGESYHRQLSSLLLCLCDVFQVVINSLVVIYAQLNIIISAFWWYRHVQVVHCDSFCGGRAHIYQAMCVRDMTAGLYRMCVWCLSLQRRPYRFCSLSPQQQQGELCAAWYTEICTKRCSPLYSSFSELFVVSVCFFLFVIFSVCMCVRDWGCLPALSFIKCSKSNAWQLELFVLVCSVFDSVYVCVCLCVWERERECKYGWMWISLLWFIVASWSRYACTDACFIHSTAAI